MKQLSCEPAALASPRRADALDALRGFAILTMALSGMIPFGIQAGWTAHLPAWMYHAQVPPPAHQFDPNLPGLTWVDLVFPFFLFSMGAAIPLALTPRLARGEPWWKLAGHAVQRGLLLLAFAVYVQHIAPTVMSPSPGTATWWLALLGFLLLFPMLTRLPRTWGQGLRAVTRLVGWGGAVAWVAIYWYASGRQPLWGPDQAGWLLHDINAIAQRSDIIIVVLGNVVVTGSILWLISRQNVPLRFAFMLGLLGIRLAKDEAGWVKDLWDWHPAPSLYRLYFQQYLLIVLPGTIVGDVIRQWLADAPATAAPGSAKAGARPAGWSRGRWLAIVLLVLGVELLLLCGLQARWLPGTPLVAIAACAAGAVLFVRPETSTEQLIRRLYGWGVLWLAIGLLFEPYEGGIKKDHPTVSYYFVTSGLACLALIFFTVLIHVLERRRWCALLVDCGQNPMIAYAGIRSLLAPVVNLVHLEPLLVKWLPTPWLGVLRGAVKTLLLATATSLCTRRRVFWRT